MRRGACKVIVEAAGEDAISCLSDLVLESLLVTDLRRARNTLDRGSGEM